MGLGNTKIRELYETEYPTLFRIACASGLGRSFADDMVQESFQALLERRDDPKVAEHENLQGWLVITLRNKIATELQRKWRHVEQPLTEISAITETSCEPSFRDSLPRQLTVFQDAHHVPGRRRLLLLRQCGCLRRQGRLVQYADLYDECSPSRKLNRVVQNFTRAGMMVLPCLPLAFPAAHMC